MRPFRQAMLLDTHHRGGIVRHHRHAHLEDGPSMAFISDAIYPSTEQAGNDAFDHRPAVAAGASKVHLVGSALAVQTRVVQDPA